MIYNIISITTGKIIASTTITEFDSDWASNDDVLDARIESAIDDDLIPDDAYEAIKASKIRGVRI